MNSSRFSPVRFSRKEAEQAILSAPTAAEAVMALYKLAYGEAFDRVRSVEEHPKAHPDDNLFLCGLIIKRSRDLAAKAPREEGTGTGWAAGIWLQYGFSADENCTPGFIYPGAAVLEDGTRMEGAAPRPKKETPAK